MGQGLAIMIKARDLPGQVEEKAMTKTSGGGGWGPGWFSQDSAEGCCRGGLRTKKIVQILQIFSKKCAVGWNVVMLGRNLYSHLELDLDPSKPDS